MTAEALEGGPLCIQQKPGKAPLPASFTRADGSPIVSPNCPTVVKFLASWCDTCSVELESFRKAIHRIPESQRPSAVIIGVFDTSEALKVHKTQHKLDIPIGIDKNGAYQQTIGLQAIPGTALLDGTGEFLKFPDPQAARDTQVHGVRGPTVLQGPRDWLNPKMSQFLASLCSGQ